MDFTVSSSVLYKHVANANRILSGKPTMPILDYLLFTVADGKLSIMASDLETTILMSLEPEAIRREGSAAIPSRLLLDTLKEFPDMPLNFTVDEETRRVQVDYNTGELVGEFSLTGGDVSEYPEMPQLAEGETTEIATTTDILVSGIAHTLFSSSSDPITPNICGILLEAKPGQLRFVATDQNRISCYTRTDVECDGEHQVFLPNRPANLLNTIMAHSGEELHIAFDDRNLQFTTPVYRLTCRLSEGQFPPYESVIPWNHPYELVVDRAMFHTALRQVAPFSHQGKNMVTLKMTPNQLTVSAKNPETSNEAYQQLACRFSGVEEFEAHFNTPYLTDGLSVISSQEVMITLSPDVRSCMMKPTQNEGDSIDLFMVLMQSLAPTPFTY